MSSPSDRLGLRAMKGSEQAGTERYPNQRSFRRAIGISQEDCSKGVSYTRYCFESAQVLGLRMLIYGAAIVCRYSEEEFCLASTQNHHRNRKCRNLRDYFHGNDGDDVEIETF